jgi:AMMECR1 domain-containing protein
VSYLVIRPIANFILCSITILSNFEEAKDAMDWELGTHGIILSLPYHGRQLSATFLPDVPVEQKWTKEETLIQLARKAGAPIKDVSKIVKSATLTRYCGAKTKASYTDYEDKLKLVQKTASKSE